MVTSSTISTVHATRPSSLDTGTMGKTTLHLQHSARNFVTEGRLALMVMLLGPQMALVGAIRGTRVCSGCSLHSLAFSIGTLEPSHESRLGGSRSSGSAAAVKHDDGLAKFNDSW